ncbi:MAG: hypothetical protein ACJ0UT_05300 [Candidatus Latescibacterota bacterium]
MRSDIHVGVPIFLEQITVDWLNIVLQGKHASTEIIGVGAGFMGSLTRLTLDYRSEPYGPQTLVAKFATHNADARKIARVTGMLERGPFLWRTSRKVPVSQSYLLLLPSQSQYAGRTAVN